MPAFKRSDVAHPLQAKQDGAYYRHGAKDFVFTGKTTLGGETIHIDLVVPTEFLRRLGANLKDERIDGDGHALWHVENPDREMPCASCSKAEEKRSASRANAIDVDIAPPKLPEKTTRIIGGDIGVASAEAQQPEYMKREKARQLPPVERFSGFCGTPPVRGSDGIA